MVAAVMDPDAAGAVPVTSVGFSLVSNSLAVGSLEVITLADDPLEGRPITLGSPVLVAKVEGSARVESCADGDTDAV